MGELGEIYRELKEESKNKRRNNYERNKARLIEAGIDFKEKANGHFIVGNYDFWATTGLFIHRKTKKRNRGILNLIATLKNEGEPI